MLITVDFGSNMEKLYSKEYLLDFLFNASSLLQNEHPNIKLELYSPTRDINKPLLASIYIEVSKGVKVVRDDTEYEYEIGWDLQNLWKNYTKKIPSNSASVHVCAK